MMDLASGGALETAAWKIRNLGDFGARLEDAARRVDEASGLQETAALAIYEAALMKSGRPVGEVRELVRRFAEAFEDEEEALTIPRASGIMNVEGAEWFFGDESLRRLTGQLLGQFQHRVAQYNYVDEREVLKRWANGYDTRLFIRRRILETEPIAGVVSGMDLPLMQYLRVAGGGDTLVPGPDVSRALVALGIIDDESRDDEYAVLAAAESLAIRLDLPAPIAGEILADLVREGRTEFPEPPPEADEAGSDAEISVEGTNEAGTGGTDQEAVKPSPDDRADRRDARRRADRGDEPTRVQDPQAKDAPGVSEEGGEDRPTPSPPETGAEDAPGTEGKGS